MARFRNYNEETQYLRHLLDTVSSNEESFSEDEELDDIEYNSNHDSASEFDSDSEHDDVKYNNNCFIGRDKETVWRKEKFRPNIRVSSKNIITKLPGNTCISKDVTSVIEAWNLLISPELIQTLVKCTNIFIKAIKDCFSRERDAKETNKAEIKAFIGL